MWFKEQQDKYSYKVELQFLHIYSQIAIDQNRMVAYAHLPLQAGFHFLKQSLNNYPTLKGL